MKKRILALLVIFALVFTISGCNKTSSQQSSNEVEVIIEEEVIYEGGDTVLNESIVSSNNSHGEDNVSTPVSSEQPTTSSQISSTVNTPSQDDTINIDYEWKSHPEDFKLLAFTFDDGPSSRILDYVNLFAAFEGAGTFFVNGRNFKGSYEYELAQNAIDYGWDIGNHGENHLVATIGGAGGRETTYEELKKDIMDLTNRLHSNLKNRDGTPYEVTSYRAPNIKPTANTFKICDELNYPIIWLTYDALDWDTTKTDKNREDVFKYGIGKWEDGDVILCHEVQQYADQTYAYIEKYLPDFFRAGYRFCSISELMELRGITRDQISGELNEVDGNRGMVKNIVKAAKQGKK